ncbi:MAG: iron-containing alcohol dehydrogenase, partial [Chloroflexota bacterium]
MPDRLDPDLVRRAANPRIIVGPGALARELGQLVGPWTLVTQAEPRALLRADVLAPAGAIRDVDSLAATDLDRLVESLPRSTGVIVGLGGGMALDAAKWCAWRTGRPLLLAPGVVSVDAVVTNSVAVREAGGVVYRGFVVAEAIVLDPDFVRQAPARLNRAGVGDLVSIHTGLHDWRLGAAAGAIPFDDGIAAAAAAVLDRVEAFAPAIGGVTDAGLEGVLRAYAEVNALCLRAGHSGPEEGSEHYLGYRL